MLITILDNQIDLVISHSNVDALVKSILLLEHQHCEEVTIHFVDSPTICSLHERYFGDSSLTDTISFPLDDEDADYRILGDVFVCPKQALNYVEKHGGDPYFETTLYVVHGMLHLLGYDDQDTSSKRKMRRAEKKHMTNLMKSGLLLT